MRVVYGDVKISANDVVVVVGYREWCTWRGFHYGSTRTEQRGVHVNRLSANCQVAHRLGLLLFFDYLMSCELFLTFLVTWGWGVGGGFLFFLLLLFSCLFFVVVFCVFCCCFCFCCFLLFLLLLLFCRLFFFLKFVVVVCLFCTL